jgi:hypothetical protein
MAPKRELRHGPWLKEALALLPEKHAIRVVRVDAGFSDKQLLGFLEQRGLSHVIVARLTRWLKREAARVTVWCALDEHYAVGEFSLQLLGWDQARRFVVILEQLRAGRASLGRKLHPAVVRPARRIPARRQPQRLPPTGHPALRFSFAVLYSDSSICWCWAGSRLCSDLGVKARRYRFR